LEGGKGLVKVRGESGTLPAFKKREKKRGGWFEQVSIHHPLRTQDTIPGKGGGEKMSSLFGPGGRRGGGIQRGVSATKNS